MSSKNNPFQHNVSNTQMIADVALGRVELAKQREYMLNMLNYPPDTIISLTQLKEEFAAIVDFEGL